MQRVHRFMTCCFAPHAAHLALSSISPAIVGSMMVEVKGSRIQRESEQNSKNRVKTRDARHGLRRAGTGGCRKSECIVLLKHSVLEVKKVCWCVLVCPRVRTHTCARVRAYVLRLTFRSRLVLYSTFSASLPAWFSLVLRRTLANKHPTQSKSQRIQLWMSLG